MLCVLLAGAGCTSDDGGDVDPTGSDRAPSEVAPLVTALPSMCEGVGPLPDEGEITFARGTLLFGVSPEGDGLRCITAVSGANPFFWVPDGSAVVDVGFTAAEIVSEAGRDVISGPDESPRFHGFSRPTGASALFTSITGKLLAKTSLSTGKTADISFLRRHDEVTFHPGGGQIAVTGETEEGVYGVFVATSEGEDFHLVVPSRDEDEFYGAAFSSDGSTLYYVDDQHSSFEVRAVDLAELQEGIVVPKSRLLLEEKVPMSIMPSPFAEDLLAYRLGTCDDGFTTGILDGDDQRAVGRGLRETQPIGWLPDGRLVIAATRDLCNPQRELDLYVVDGDTVELLVEDVAYAGVRAALPDAPRPVSGPVGPRED
jgi:hypothetical protein